MTTWTGTLLPSWRLAVAVLLPIWDHGAYAIEPHSWSLASWIHADAS